jgi:hypothetical protein
MILMSAFSFAAEDFSIALNYSDFFDQQKCEFEIKDLNLPEYFKNNACHLRKEKLASFNILTLQKSPTCENTLVLIGENHDAEPLLRSSTYNLVNSFQIIFFENSWDSDLIKNYSPTKFDMNSPSYDSAGSAMLDLGKEKDIIQKMFFQEQEVCVYFPKTGDLKVLGCDLLEKKIADIKKRILIDSELGRLNHYNYNCTDRDSFDCQLYVMVARNHRMAYNINRHIQDMPCGMTTAAISGAAHVHDVSKILQLHGYKFKPESPSLSESSYAKLPHTLYEF